MLSKTMLDSTYRWKENIDLFKMCWKCICKHKQEWHESYVSYTLIHEIIVDSFGLDVYQHTFLSVSKCQELPSNIIKHLMSSVWAPTGRALISTWDRRTMSDLASFGGWGVSAFQSLLYSGLRRFNVSLNQLIGGYVFPGLCGLFTLGSSSALEALSWCMLVSAAVQRGSIMAFSGATPLNSKDHLWLTTVLPHQSKQGPYIFCNRKAVAHVPLRGWNASLKPRKTRSLSPEAGTGLRNLSQRSCNGWPAVGQRKTHSVKSVKSSKKIPSKDFLDLLLQNLQTQKLGFSVIVLVGESPKNEASTLRVSMFDYCFL